MHKHYVPSLRCCEGWGPFLGRTAPPGLWWSPPEKYSPREQPLASPQSQDILLSQAVLRVYAHMCPRVCAHVGMHLPGRASSVCAHGPWPLIAELTSNRIPRDPCLLFWEYQSSAGGNTWCRGCVPIAPSPHRCPLLKVGCAADAEETNKAQPLLPALRLSPLLLQGSPIGHTQNTHKIGSLNQEQEPPTYPAGKVIPNLLPESLKVAKDGCL